MTTRVEAYGILAAELVAYRDLPFDELAQLVGRTYSHRAYGSDSREYLVDVAVRRRDGRDDELVIDGTTVLNECGPLQRVDETIVVRRLFEKSARSKASR
jgi:hypothetical protein